MIAGQDGSFSEIHLERRGHDGRALAESITGAERGEGSVTITGLIELLHRVIDPDEAGRKRGVHDLHHAVFAGPGNMIEGNADKILCSGIALAKLRGAYKGRKKALSLEEGKELREQAYAGIPKADLARAYGISRETVYQYLRSS